MKTTFSQTLALFITIASLSATISSARAQDSNTTAQASSPGITTTDATTAQTDSAATVQTASTTAPAPQLAYGVSQILELQQAKVDDNIIINYIRNSGNSYGLNADQIIYLRQQGISSAVLNAMLNQPAPGVLPPGNSVPQPSGPAPQVSYYQPAPADNGIVGPSVSGIDPSAAAAANYYYYPPAYGYSYPYSYAYPYYYPSVGFYPGVSVGWGGRFGPAWGGWHGGGWGGGFHGGFGGGGFHGGGFHGGGGWHH